MILYWLPAWPLVASVVTFAAFGYDKQQAREGGWRVSEGTLLGLALIGGSPGAIAGVRYFRHKTRKEPFRSTLFTIVILQIVVIAVAVASPAVLLEVAHFIS